MTKTTTSIRVDEEILDFCRSNHISLSEWVCREFGKQFLGLQSKLTELGELENKADELRGIIKAQKERLTQLNLQVTNLERRYLKNVPERHRSGFNMKSMHDFYNNEFSRNLSFDEFISLVELYKTK
jgi:hypothetical protein